MTALKYLGKDGIISIFILPTDIDLICADQSRDIVLSGLLTITEKLKILETPQAAIFCEITNFLADMAGEGEISSQ